MISDEEIGSPLRQVAIKAILTSIEDQKFIIQGTDPGQSTFGSLSVSSTIIGIGRSNNFVEMFTASIFNQGQRRMRDWSPIIPKSVLYIMTET